MYISYVSPRKSSSHRAHTWIGPSYSLFKSLRSPSSKFRVDYSIVTWARKWATALTHTRRRVSHRTRPALTTFSHTYPLIIYPYAQYVSIPNLHVTFNPFSEPAALTDNPSVGLISTPGTCDTRQITPETRRTQGKREQPYDTHCFAIDGTCRSGVEACNNSLVIRSIALFVAICDLLSASTSNIRS